jgi:hypothetical protein
MRDEKYTPEVGAWLKGREVPPPDSQPTARRVATRLPQVRQRNRWWPFPVFYRKARTHTTIDTINDRFSPDLAANGPTPTVIGRTQPMFSPVKAITAGALVFAIGSAFLIAQPLERRDRVPGAETEAIAPTWVTGNVQPAPTCSSPDLEVDGDVRRSRNVECSPQTWTSSDPRLTGEVVRRWNDDIYETDEGTISVSMDAAYLRNDDGGWACTNSGLAKGSGTYAQEVTGGTDTHTCIGDGGYEGLSAILVLSAGQDFSEEFVGLIFSGDFPPLPEAPAAE